MNEQHLFRADFNSRLFIRSDFHSYFCSIVGKAVMGTSEHQSFFLPAQSFRLLLPVVHLLSQSLENFLKNGGHYFTGGYFALRKIAQKAIRKKIPSFFYLDCPFQKQSNFYFFHFSICFLTCSNSSSLMLQEFKF